MTEAIFPLPPDKKHPARCAVYDRWRRRSPLETKEQSYEEIGREFGISASTVKRWIKRVESGAFAAPAGRQGRSVYAWDADALSFFTGFYLTALAKVGCCTVRNAYAETVREAQRRGWRVGSVQSAYVHAKNISPAMVMLAKGGQRALDNMFYISRDLSSLRPFQLIVGDQHRFDFWCYEPESRKYIRAECYLWLDMATRLVYGISFDRNYSARTVVRALRMGIRRFGKFEGTYNDNGSSEKSELADYIVERLQGYGVRFLDEADLYHADNGRYIVEDQNSCVVDVVRSKAEWHRQHRRIFARVKNAKTKPIERFFSTLEQILQDMKLPGYIKELGLSAPEEEQAQKRLDWQRRNGYVLTYDEFIAKVLEAVKIYENRRHGTLGCSPRERLAEYERNGWQPVFIDPRDEAYLFMERAFATVRGDRVQLAGREYIGPDLTQEMVLENRSSLVAYSGRKIELRFDPDNLDAGVFAIEPDTSRAIALRPAEKIDMLDHDDLSRQLAWKKRNMAAVSSAFEAITKDKTVRVLSDGGAFRELRRAEELAARPETPASGGAPETHHSRPAESRKSMERTEIPSALRTSGTELSDGEFWSGVAERISRENIVRTHGKKVFLTERERYQDLLERLLDGDRISGEDMAFKNRYEAKMTDQEKAYARAIIRQNTQEE